MTKVQSTIDIVLKAVAIGMAVTVGRALIVGLRGGTFHERFDHRSQ